MSKNIVLKVDSGKISVKSDNVQLKRSEVERMIDVTKGRVRFYVDQGVIPDFEPSRGRGFERPYSKREVFMLAIAAEMSRFGVSLELTKRFIRHLTDHEGEVLNVENYRDDKFMPLAFITQDNFIVRFSSDDFSTLISNGVTCVINFSSIFKAIDW